MRGFPFIISQSQTSELTQIKCMVFASLTDEIMDTNNHSPIDKIHSCYLQKHQRIVLCDVEVYFSSSLYCVPQELKSDSVRHRHKQKKHHNWLLKNKPQLLSSFFTSQLICQNIVKVFNQPGMLLMIQAYNILTALRASDLP